MILTEVFPNSGNTAALDLANAEALKQWYPEVTGIRVNFVLGRNADASGNSDEVTSRADRTLLRFIRSQSDLIVTTGKTARAENLSASSYANLLIVTNSDESFSIPATEINKGLPVMLTQRLETEYANVSAAAIGKIQEPITQFVTAFCRANSYSRPVLEAGLPTIREFSNSNLIEEIDLTVTGSSDEDEAQAQAVSFIRKIGSESVLIQLLNFEDNWFFRFGNASANH